MDYALIFNGKATLEDLLELTKLGYRFVLENGKVTAAIKPREERETEEVTRTYVAEIDMEDGHVNG